MSKLFNKESVQFVTKSIDWKDAISKGVDILVKQGKATPELAKAIFKQTEKLGAYYVLEKGLALCHASPGPYSKEAASSVLFLKENIQFNNEDKWAKVIFVLSSPDETSHIGHIQEFGKYFMDDKVKQKIFNVRNWKELEQIIDKRKEVE